MTLRQKTVIANAAENMANVLTLLREDPENKKEMQDFFMEELKTHGFDEEEIDRITSE